MTCRNGNFLPDIILKNVWSPIIWRDGVRLSSNFISSSFMVLDFDEPGNETMAEIGDSFQDTAHIIGTTKSHMIYKEGKGICDRFRLIVPWDTMITDLEVYLFNMKLAYKKYPWADKSCLDGARWFYPCKEIISIERGPDLFRWEVRPAEQTESKYDAHSRLNTDRLPSWLLSFINTGYISQGTSRRWKLFAAARELACFGWDDERIFNTLIKIPLDFTGITHADIRARIKSARSKI